MELEDAFTVGPLATREKPLHLESAAQAAAAAEVVTLRSAYFDLRHHGSSCHVHPVGAPTPQLSSGHSTRPEVMIGGAPRTFDGARVSVILQWLLITLAQVLYFVRAPILLAEARSTTGRIAVRVEDVERSAASKA